MTAPKALTEIRNFVATIPRQTPQATPVTVSLLMPPRTVLGLALRFPPGPNGELGVRLGSSGGVIIPDNAGAWIIASDEVINWDLRDQINSGGWELTGYNTGLYDHSVYLRFIVVLPARKPFADTAGAVVSTLSAPAAVASTPPPAIDTGMIGGGL